MDDSAPATVDGHGPVRPPRSGPGPDSTAGRQAWESAARACYRAVGVPFPERVVWVSSPLVGAFAAPISACLTTGHRNRRVLDAVHRAVDHTAGETVGRAVREAVRAAADDEVRDPVHGAAATALHLEIARAIGTALTSTAPDPARSTRATGPALPAATLAMIVEATDPVVRAAVDAAVGGPRQDTVRGAIRRLWHARLTGPGSRPWLTLVDRLPPGPDRPSDDDPHVTSDPAPPADPDVTSDAGRVAAGSTSHGWWWWPFRDFVMFSPGPVELHLEQGDDGATDRPHRADGPAVAWADGFGLHFWHGTPVPRAIVEDTLTVAQILREPNAEVRRCAIERRGWDRFVGEAGLAQVGPAVPDPGNPGQTLTLHDVPEGVYTTHVRVLLCTNGTVERDGTRRRFGLTVPAHCAGPIEAAAWTYGLTAAEYATAQRRS